jgi:hypothetical protein
MLRTITYSIAALWLLLVPVYTQTASSNKEIENYFTAALKGQNYPLSTEAVKGADGKKILKLSGQNISNTNAQVRYKIIDLVKRKAFTEPDGDIRKKFVHFLIASVKDKDSGNSGVASKALTRFVASDFDRQAADSLYNLLVIKPYHYDQIIKLAGFLNIDKCKVLLQHILAGPLTLL